MKQQHNKSFIVMMILVTSLFIWYQSNQILKLDISYVDTTLSPRIGLVYIGLLLYIPIAFLIVLYLPSRLLFRVQLRLLRPNLLHKQTPRNTHQTIIVRISFNRTISYQVIRC
jgi:hypothetical protein